MSDNNKNEFPRKLSQREKEWLEFILPENKIGYSEYRERIKRLHVIGHGRFGETNFVLGDRDDKPNLTAPSSAVFASGVIKYKEAELYILIHEEFEDKIEFDISNKQGSAIPENLTEMSKWNYSEWEPGKKAPGDNTEVREVHLIKNKLVIAIASKHKRIWVHEQESGVNYFIPVSNFFNEIMRVREIKDAKQMSSPRSIFAEVNSFTDKEIAQGFLLYNKHWNKIKIDNSLFQVPQKQLKKKRFFSFLK